MSDARISALTELAETPATGDLFAVVDVSDATDAASGTTKKITYGNLFSGHDIGSDVQAFDADLSAVAGLSTAGIIVRTGAGTAAARTITGTANQITVTNGDGVSGNPTLSLPADVVIPTVITAPNTGLHVLDTDASHDLILKPGSNLGADRTLTITTGDADRTLDISAGSVTISTFGATLVDDADASTARTTLGLVIGTDVQGFDSDLSAVAGLSSNGIIARTGAGTASVRTITGTSNEVSVSNGDGVSGNPTIGLASIVDLTSKVLVLPTDTAPTVDANGEIALDTLITDMSHGLLKYYSGEVLAVIAVPVGELTGMANGDVIKYDSTADEFVVGAGASGGGDLVVFVPALAGNSAGTVTQSTAWGPEYNLADASFTSWACQFKVPSGASSISSVKLLYEVRATSGNVRCDVINMSIIDVDTHDSTITTDASGATTLTLTAGTVGRLGIYTFASTVYDGLTIDVDDIITFAISRDGGDAADTYAADFRLIGLLVTFA